MPELKETAEAVTETMSFMQEFLQKKYAWGIVFFVIIIGGFVTAVVFYNNGVKVGKETSIESINSFKESGKNDSIQITRWKNYSYDLQKRLDTCNKASTNSNLEDLVTKKLAEAERLKKILEHKITNDEKLQDNLKSILK